MSRASARRVFRRAARRGPSGPAPQAPRAGGMTVVAEPVADRLVMLDGAPVERVLVVTAHPDDVDFGAAGSVATWSSAGIDVTYCVVTDGAAGSQDRHAGPQRGLRAATKHGRV